MAKKVKVTGRANAEKIWALLMPRIEGVFRDVEREFPELKNVVSLYRADIKARLSKKGSPRDTLIFLEECSTKEAEEALVGKLVLKACRFFTDIAIDVEEDSGAPLIPEDILEKPISFLGRGAKLQGVAKHFGISTVGQLIGKTAKELLRVKGFKVGALNSLRKKLQQYNLKLEGD